MRLGTLFLLMILASGPAVAEEADETTGLPSVDTLTVPVAPFAIAVRAPAGSVTVHLNGRAVPLSADPTVLPFVASCKPGEVCVLEEGANQITVDVQGPSAAGAEVSLTHAGYPAPVWYLNTAHPGHWEDPVRCEAEIPSDFRPILHIASPHARYVYFENPGCTGQLDIQPLDNARFPTRIDPSLVAKKSVSLSYRCATEKDIQFALLGQGFYNGLTNHVLADQGQKETVSFSAPSEKNH